MSKSNLEKAYQDDLHARQAAQAAQAALDEWSAKQTDLTGARDETRSDAEQADAQLMTAAQATPPDSVAETTDGKILLVFGGSLHLLTKVAAADVPFDDGTTDPTPGPEPTPEPDPFPFPPAPVPDEPAPQPDEPAPRPDPSPEVPPVPEPDPAPAPDPLPPPVPSDESPSAVPAPDPTA